MALLFSCNGISDEDMDIRLAELELMQLANEHLEEDIEGLHAVIEGKMALPENKSTIGPLVDKKQRLDSLCVDFRNYIHFQGDFNQIKLNAFNQKSDAVFQNIYDIIGTDSSQSMKIFDLIFDRVKFDYPILILHQRLIVYTHISLIS